MDGFLIRQTFNSQCVYSHSKHSVALAEGTSRQFSQQMTDTDNCAEAFEKTAEDFIACGIRGRKVIAAV